MHQNKELGYRGEFTTERSVLEIQGMSPILFSDTTEEPLPNPTKLSFSLSDKKPIAASFGPNSAGKSTLLAAIKTNLLPKLNGWPHTGSIQTSTFTDIFSFFGAPYELGAEMTQLERALRHRIAIMNARKENHFQHGQALYLFDEINGAELHEVAAIDRAIINKVLEEGDCAIWNSHARMALIQDPDPRIQAWEALTTVNEVQQTITPHFRSEKISSEQLKKISSQGRFIAKKYMHPEDYLALLEIQRNRA